MHDVFGTHAVAQNALGHSQQARPFTVVKASQCRLFAGGAGKQVGFIIEFGDGIGHAGVAGWQESDRISALKISLLHLYRSYQKPACGHGAAVFMRSHRVCCWRCAQAAL
jgi:hypothetical protein